MSESEKTKSVERRRQDLILGDRELYDYLFNVIAAKLLDSIGDTASGVDHRLANQLWARAGQHRRAAEAARND